MEAQRDAMFAGEKINTTEDRAVLHIALRAAKETSIVVDGKDVVKESTPRSSTWRTFSDAVRLGKFRGYTDKAIRHVVNIGIGGSDLGPVMITEALKAFKNKGLPQGTESADDALRLQRGRHPHRGRAGQGLRSGDRRSSSSPPRPSPRPGDPGERQERRGPGSSSTAGKDEEAHRQALRRPLHQRDRGEEIRHRPRQYVRLLGLGGRALLALVLDRALHRPLDWLPELPRPARGRARDG